MNEVNRTIVIIPAYNEARNIAEVITHAQRNMPFIDILVVDDDSFDNTSLVARNAGSSVVKLPFNLGYGNALQTGYKYALFRGYEYLIQMDGDGQHDPQSIKDLYDEITKNEFDIIIGSRFLKKTYNPPLLRKIGMKFFARIAELMVGQKFTDPTSGFRALNKKALQLYCQDIYPNDFPDVDVIIMSKKAGLRIKEIPVVMHPSPETKKSMHSGLKPIYYIFKMILSIFVTILRDAEIEGGIHKSKDA